MIKVYSEQIKDRRTYILLMIAKDKEEKEWLSVLDALSASGLRTIRFLQELDHIKLVHANDLDKASCDMMNMNFKLNNLDMSKVKGNLFFSLSL